MLARPVFLGACCMMLLAYPQPDINIDCPKGWTQFGYMCASMEDGLGPLHVRPPTEIRLIFYRESNEYHRSAKIYIGPLPGTRYSIGGESGKHDQRYFQQSFEMPDDSTKRVWGAPYFYWFAHLLEKEDKDSIIEQVANHFYENAVQVIKGFRLQVDTPSEVANALKQEFLKAIRRVKKTKDENVLFQEVVAFDAATEEKLTKYGLERQGNKMPAAISFDPWLYLIPDGKNDIGSHPNFCGHQLCHTIGLAEYLLHLTFWENYARNRIRFFAKQFWKLNVTHIATIVSQTEMIGLIHRYKKPYGDGKKVGQYSEVHWDGNEDTFDEMHDQLRISVGQPNELSKPMAVSGYFLRRNTFSDEISRRWGIEQVWPAWERAEVPAKGWAKATRYRMFRVLEDVLRKGKNVYCHGKGDSGRVGMFAIILLMEISESYWLDILKFVREAVPGSVDSAQQVLYIEQHWRKYTAKYFPLNGDVGDPENWDTGRPKEMSEKVAPIGTRYSYVVSSVAKRPSSTLREELDKERLEMMKQKKTRHGFLQTLTALQNRESRRFFGCFVCSFLYGVFVIIITTLGLQFRTGPSLMGSRDGFVNIHRVESEGIELPSVSSKNHPDGVASFTCSAAGTIASAVGTETSSFHVGSRSPTVNAQSSKSLPWE